MPGTTSIQICRNSRKCRRGDTFKLSEQPFVHTSEGGRLTYVPILFYCERRRYNAKQEGIVSDTLDLFGPQPRRPLRGERLFYAFLLDQDDARRVGQFGQDFLDENNFQGRLLPENRRHISLHHLGDHRHLRSSRVYAAEKAGDRISMSAFEVALDAIMSFGAMPKPGRTPGYPLVLHGRGEGLFELHAKLGIAMEQYGMRAFHDFMPHLTLSYGEWPVLARPIKPIWVPVTGFCLIHSRLGLTEYRILKRWTLNKPRTMLH